MEYIRLQIIKFGEPNQSEIKGYEIFGNEASGVNVVPMNV